MAGRGSSKSWRGGLHRGAAPSGSSYAATLVSPWCSGVQQQRLDLLSISWCTPVVGNCNVDGHSGAVLFPHNGTTAGQWQQNINKTPARL